jgi:hypothetical protein
MKTRSFAVARTFLGERAHRSRREREIRRSERRLVAIASIVLIAAAGMAQYLAPRDRPVVTVYMRADCDSCRSWMRYLESHGFKTQVGAQSEWAAVRARFRLPPRFRSLHTAVVDGLLIEGHVPAGEIYDVLAMPDHGHIRGLVVPGLPRGGPGLHTLLARPYVVYAMQDSGLMRPFSEHHHDIQ